MTTQTFLCVDKGRVAITTVVRPDRIYAALVPGFSGGGVPGNLLLLGVGGEGGPTAINKDAVNGIDVPSVVTFFPKIIFAALHTT